MNEYMKLLGHKVKDRVTGFVGVVTSITFDLYGCVQVLVHPGLDKEGKPHEQQWFDFKRLEQQSKQSVMPPQFSWMKPAGSEAGPESKPRYPAT